MLVEIKKLYQCKAMLYCKCKVEIMIKYKIYSNFKNNKNTE